jgi:hypothetical protein
MRAQRRLLSRACAAAHAALRPAAGEEARGAVRALHRRVLVRCFRCAANTPAPSSGALRASCALDAGR